jgi:molybdate transport system substrate-binding protein
MRGAVLVPRRVALALAACLLASLGCGSSESEGRLLVFAAASTTDVLTELFEPEPRVRLSFGPSSALARQLEDGAPADLFVSASKRWVEEVVDRGLVVGRPVLLARNAIVCVAGSGSELSGRSVASPAALLAALEPGELVALADEGVPVGEYARASLRASGSWAEWEGRLVGQVDARDCLRAARTGQAAAAFVYATDARLGGVEVLFELQPLTHESPELWAVRTSERPGARELLAELQGARAREVFARAGFRSPEELR